MDNLTEVFRIHHQKRFLEYGASSKGVHWNDEGEVRFRYQKILQVLQDDFGDSDGEPSLLDVGCGWGGLYAYCEENRIGVKYIGIDLVQAMIDYASQKFRTAAFHCRDVLEVPSEEKYDYVVCLGALTQKLDATIPQMTAYARRVILKMFELCNRGIAFNLMSNRVNFMAPNLYYTSPVEVLDFCLSHVSPRVRLDHGFSSLNRGIGKLYDYMTFIYKD